MPLRRQTSSSNTTAAAATLNPALHFDDGRTRRRSAVACRICHLRKVRCNVATTGIPCANCQHDQTVCEVLPRKKHGARRKHIYQSANSQNVVEPQNQQHQSPRSVDGEISYPQFPTSAPALGLPQGSLDIDPNLPLSGDGNADKLMSEGPVESETDDGAHTTHYAAALDSDEGDVTNDNPSLLYIGDQQGANSFVFELCNGTSHTSHYLVPRVTANTQRPEDLVYLRFKGCFSLPSSEVCEQLIRSYFRNVHPFLPIVNAKAFLEDFVQSGYQNLNLLLLWSMFLAASNFVEHDVLQKAGYTSRRGMKRAMFQRAKSLYDSDYEEDKVSLIQSVILMAFWYSDTEERNGAWHWMGIAIGLCQAMGMHRNPRTDNRSYLSKDKIGLFRRIWWCCFVRDRWLSLSMGRPMRIHLEDGDVPMATAEDVTKELESLDPAIKEKYLLANMDVLSGLWIKLLKITDVLGSMIRNFYGSKDGEPNISKLRERETKMLEYAPDDRENALEDPTALLYVHQLQLFYEATIIMLHRPSLHLKIADDSASEDSSWQAQSRHKAKAAATNINVVLERLIDADMIKFLKPMSVTCLITAMQIHLLETTSSKSLSRSFGRHKFGLCMMVLSELQDTYCGAEVMYKMFQKAEDKLQSHATRRQGLESADPSKGIPLTPDSSTSAQIQIVNTQEQEYSAFMNMDSLIWDQPDLMSMLGSDAFMGSSVNLMGDALDALDAENSHMNDGLNENFGLNELMSPERFNNQCLYTAPSN